MPDKTVLLEWLRQGLVEVTFTKADGSERKMKCTLRQGLVPETKSTDSKRARPENLLSVWSSDDQGWRSFYLDRVKTIRFLH
jgi:hypothetical protein